MTAPLIAPVIPSPAAARPARASLARAAADAAGQPAGAGRDVVYGLGRIDHSGRVADRAITGALGWRGGDRLTLTAEAGVVVTRRDPAGLVTLPPRSYVLIPAALRRRCGLRAGDHVPARRLARRGHADRVLVRGGGPGAAAHIPFPARKEEADDDHRT